MLTTNFYSNLFCCSWTLGYQKFVQDINMHAPDVFYFGWICRSKIILWSINGNLEINYSSKGALKSMLRFIFKYPGYNWKIDSNLNRIHLLAIANKVWKLKMAMVDEKFNSIIDHPLQWFELSYGWQIYHFMLDQLFFRIQKTQFWLLNHLIYQLKINKLGIRNIVLFWNRWKTIWLFFKTLKRLF